MGKVLVLPSRSLEVKGKLASFPWGAAVLVPWADLMKSLCQQGAVMCWNQLCDVGARSSWLWMNLQGVYCANCGACPGSSRAGNCVFSLALLKELV